MSVGNFQGLFISARLAVVLVALLSLFYIGKNRLEQYSTNMIIHESKMKKIDKPYFDLSLCYGPKFSEETVSLYLITNNLRQLHPDTWREKVKDLKSKDIHFSGAEVVDSIEQYRDFFYQKFNWSVDSMYDVGLPANLESMKLGWFRHTFTTNNSELIKVDYNFYNFKYSWCYNYTYNNEMFNRSVDSSKSKGGIEDPFHSVGLHDYQYDWNFGNNSISEYIDAYIYPRKHEHEFPLVEDHVPFRIDMLDWQRLRASARKVRRQNRPPKFSCHDQEEHNAPTYNYNKCLTWCLRRTLLNHINCTIPEIDNYIYNISAIMNTYTSLESKKRKRFRSKYYFNNRTAWPWMKTYIHLEPCDSAQSFLKVFNTFEKIFFPSGDKFAMNQSCGTECPPECTEFDVLIATEGNELHAPTEHIHGVTIYYSGRVEEIRESWKYTMTQLLIDLSGVMSFLLGLSMIAIHEWIFVLTRWLVEKCSRQNESPSQLLGDDVRYDDYDGFADHSQSYVGSQHSQDYDEYYDDYSGEHDEDYGEYDNNDDTWDYGDESFDHAGEIKVIEAVYSGMVHGPGSAAAYSEPTGKTSYLAP